MIKDSGMMYLICCSHFVSSFQKTMHMRYQYANVGVKIFGALVP